jgi:DNA-binding GntR family transcriptional regulator
MEAKRQLISKRRGGEKSDLHSDRRSSVDDVYDQILVRIITGKLSVGRRLSSTTLARELAVSRTPVVSAIDRLVSDGILTKEKNRTPRICKGADEWLLQIHQLRELLEPPAAALAAELMPEDELNRLEHLADAATPFRDASWLDAAREYDFALHLAIADHCGNVPLRKTIHRCWQFKRLSYELGCRNIELEEVGFREHMSILAALKNRDAKTASAAMLFHLRSSLQFTREGHVV